MPDYPIDLGKSYDGPMQPVDVKPSEKKSYPTLYLDWDESYDLPNEGVMEVRFRKRSETNREDDRGTHQSVELEIREILDVESEADEAAEEESGSEALDKYRKEQK